MISLMWINRKEGDFTFAWMERETPVLGPALQSNRGFFVASAAARDRGRE